MNEKLIFKCVVGSQSHGTSTPQSDIDIKGVYMQSIDDLITFNYKPQIDVNKDETYWEVQRFIQLAQTANPSVLEILFSPDDCILETSPQFDLLRENRYKFLTKKCLQSFGGYVKSQLVKASGLDKKMNWEKERIERKEILDFVYAVVDGKTIPIKEWLINSGYTQERCGLTAIDHFNNCYALYYDNFKCPDYKYNGLMSENSQQLKLSSIPKGETPVATISFNKEHYSKHCKEYKEYTEWLAKRNTNRYVDSITHGQQIDGKNLLHCRRLLDIAKEIATTGDFSVKRPNREELLAIKKGKVNLEDITATAQIDLEELNHLYENSNLPEECDMEFVNDLLLQIRLLGKNTILGATELEYIYDIIEDAKQYRLEHEVIGSAIMYSINGDAKTIQDAMFMGFNEWVK